MEFPITDLLDEELSTQWLLKHFHPEGLRCPRCGSRIDEARTFRRIRRSGLVVYRCWQCDQTSTLYTGPVFEHRQVTPMQVVLLLRGVCKGEPTAILAREPGLTRGTVHEIRKVLQTNAQALQPVTPLSDHETETDEMFQNAGKKGDDHTDLEDPPRRGANKRRGRGTYVNDRPFIIGTIGRDSGQVQLRVVKNTTRPTLCGHVHQFTEPEARVYTDEYDSYHSLKRSHATVCHAVK